MLKFLVLVALTTIGDANCARTATLIRSAPFVVSLQMRKSPSENFGRCAATIISKDWVVTAASCINQPSKLESYYILAGTDDRTRGGSTHEISKIVIHEKFAKTRTNEFVNDIALIKVKKSFVLDPTRQAATPSDKKLPPKDTLVPISGWGASQSSRNVPKILSVLSEKIISPDECQKFYKNPVPEKQFCTSYTPDQYFTQNESGNPIVLQVKGVPHLLGIGTWSSGSTLPGRPNVFTDISQYRDWIESKIAK